MEENIFSSDPTMGVMADQASDSGSSWDTIACKERQRHFNPIFENNAKIINYYDNSY